MFKRKFLLACLVIMLTGTAQAGVFPFGNEGQVYSSYEQLSAGKAISKGEAIRIVQDSVGGRVLSAKRKGKYYRIKVVKKGVVRVYYVDAYSGELSR